MCIVHRAVIFAFSVGLLGAPGDNTYADPEPYSAPDYGAVARAARLSGQSDQYRAALLQFAAFSEFLAEYGSLGNPVLLDAMRAYYKLSKLEASLGRTEESQRYLLKAISTCEVVRDFCSATDLDQYETTLEMFEEERERQW